MSKRQMMENQAGPQSLRENESCSNCKKFKKEIDRLNADKGTFKKKQRDKVDAARRAEATLKYELDAIKRDGNYRSDPKTSDAVTSDTEEDRIETQLTLRSSSSMRSPQSRVTTHRNSDADAEIHDRIKKLEGENASSDQAWTEKYDFKEEQLKTEIKDLKALLLQKETEQSLILQELKETKESLEAMRKALDESKTKIEDMKESVRDKDKNNLDLLSEKDSVTKAGSLAQKELTKASKKLDKLRSKHDKIKNEAQTEIETLVRKTEKLEEENKSLLEKLTPKARLTKKSPNSNYEVKIEKLETEKTELLLRISRVASKQLVEGNPAIADLSDERRPTKLAEMFSELYDNEWTDAFDEQFPKIIKNEVDTIGVLLRITKSIHDCCQAISSDYLAHITSAASSSVVFEEQQLFEPGRNGNGPLEMSTTLKTIRRMVAPFLQKEIESDLLATWKKEDIKRGDKTNCFIKKCLELFWEMSVKDPPVVMMSLPELGSEVDKREYRYYTKIGPRVKFVVWPALLLHKDGPLLSKGIIQGR